MKRIGCIIEAVWVVGLSLFQILAFVLGGLIWFDIIEPESLPFFPWLSGYSFISMWVLVVSILLLPVICILNWLGMNPTDSYFYPDRKD